MPRDEVCIPIDEEPSHPPPVYGSSSHVQLSRSLVRAISTSRLGSGPAETDPTDYSLLTNWFCSVPWRTIVCQLLWSFVVTTASFFLADRAKLIDTFSVHFWISELNNSSFVISAMGWGLFALLAFFIKDAFGRYREALMAWNQMQHLLRQGARQFIQMFPEGTWHDGDRERIIAHLTAYPIALKMQLRDEWEPAQLRGILDERDIDDVIDSPSMHLHCSKVVRSYLTSVEDDCLHSFAASVAKSPGSDFTRNFVNRIVDHIDLMAGKLERIGNFQSSAGYISHLRLFMYIWFFFVPVAFIPKNGWFTIVWSVGVTYGVGMIFVIASELNDPFGFDLRDIKLNKLAATASLGVMRLYAHEEVSIENVLNESTANPTWLEDDSWNRSSGNSNEPESKNFFSTLFFPFMWLCRIMWGRLCMPAVHRPLLLFISWAVFSTAASWGVTKVVKLSNIGPKCRWWCTFLPPHQTTTSCIGLAVFLLLGLVTIDSCNRYWEGLMIWDNEIRTCIAQMALHIGITCRQGIWHSGDRERFFSHIAALPVAIKQFLRDSRDLNELESILSREDLAALRDAPELPAHCFHVIYGYLNSASQPDSNTFAEAKSPFRELMYCIQDSAWRIEFNVQQCEALRKFPIPQALISHLQVFMGMWLLMVPLTLADHDGFLVLIYSTTVAFSVINMLTVGKELADPFGEEPDDIPLDDMCLQIQKRVMEVYRHTKTTPSAFLRESCYFRDKFTPKADRIDPASEAWDEECRTSHPEKGFVSRAFNYIRPGLRGVPACSTAGMMACIIWAAVSSCSSYVLSHYWDQSSCKASWRCSPIQVDPYLLSYTGFALFLILAFRANDAFVRYETGGKLLTELDDHLRYLALEIIQVFAANKVHSNDVERIIAHILQIPLSLRSHLIGGAGKGSNKREGFLSDQDHEALCGQEDKVQYCIHVVQAFLINADCAESDSQAPSMLLKYIFRRIARVQFIVSYSQTVKRFPLVKSFTEHQRLFTGFWLALLPLGMMDSSGFYTIVWAPLISYAVLGLDSICYLLEDPYGNDHVDLPIQRMCTEMVENVLEAVRSIDWGYRKHVVNSQCDENGLLGCKMLRAEVRGKYIVGSFIDESVERGVQPSKAKAVLRPPIRNMGSRTIFAHMHRSVPWMTLLIVWMWTVLTVIFAFATRDAGQSHATNNWIPTFGISQEVAIYFSFATFLMVSYYVQAAFLRYREAGKIWRDQMGSTCHALLVQWMSLFPPGTWHEGDHQRAIAHIISLPIALKMEVRGRRDVRELKGLLSKEDVGKLHCADVMPLHCIDVIRSYFISAIAHKDKMAIPYKILGSKRRSPVRREIANLEAAIRSSLFIARVELTPAAFALLSLLLSIWAVILPFILSEVAGWLTILLMPIIAYGIFGLVNVAQEIRDPFGNDLNDFDLDHITSDVVQDLLYTFKSYNAGFDSLIRCEDPTDFWQTEDYGDDDTVSRRGSLHSSAHKMISNLITRWGPFMKLTMLSLPLKMVSALVVWSFMLTALSWLLRSDIAGQSTLETCESAWWCSPLTIHSRLFKYGGFALFFLLSKRLYDSHLRYVQGLVLWCEQMMGLSSLISNRIFSSAKRGSWHEGDFERIAAHLAGYAISVAGELRTWSANGTGSVAAKVKFRDDLYEVMSENDAERVLISEQPADYCLDVVRAYIVSKEYATQHEIPRNEIKILVRLLAELKNVGANCKAVQREPMPFGYIQHLRIFMVLWLVLLPLGLVEAAGWLTPLWVLLIAFGIIGTENWAIELSDPFGTDISDLPMDELQDDVILEIQENLKLFSRSAGGHVLIRPDRRGFTMKSS